MVLSAKERLLRTIAHEESDYVPSFFKDVQMGFISKYEQIYDMDPTDDQILSFRGNSTYTMARYWGTTASCDFFANAVADPSFKYKNIQLEDGKQIHPDGRIYQTNTQQDHTYYIDGYWTDPEHRAQTPPLATPSPERFQEWKKFSEAHPDFYLMPMMHGLHEGTHLNVGMKTFSRVFRSAPVMKFYESLLDDLLKVNMETCAQILEVDPTAIISFSDDVAYKDRLMISPQQFERLYGDRYRKLFGFIHQRGGKTMIHSDGLVDDLIPTYIDVGLDIIQCLEPAANVNIFELDAKYGDKITWNGNVDVSRLLAFGPEEKVVENTKELLQKLGPNGGYIFGPCTSIEYWQDPKMLHAMWESYKKYRVLH